LHRIHLIGEIWIREGEAMLKYFHELLEWQEDLANEIIALQDEILRLEQLEQELWQRREQALLYEYLGLKQERKEIEYTLHEVQEQLGEKHKELKRLQDDLEARMDMIIAHYRRNSVSSSEA
jgi:chromosome segregation ATPase